MIRYLKQYKFLLFLTVLFTAISSLSYVFIAILLQQVMDIVDMGDMDGFIRILLFSLAYFALMGVFMYLQSLFSKNVHIIVKFYNFFSANLHFFHFTLQYPYFLLFRPTTAFTGCIFLHFYLV